MIACALPTVPSQQQSPIAQCSVSSYSASPRSPPLLRFVVVVRQPVRPNAGTKDDEDDDEDGAGMSSFIPFFAGGHTYMTSALHNKEDSKCL